MSNLLIDGFILNRKEYVLYNKKTDIIHYWYNPVEFDPEIHEKLVLLTFNSTFNFENLMDITSEVNTLHKLRFLLDALIQNIENIENYKNHSVDFNAEYMLIEVLRYDTEEESKEREEKYTIESEREKERKEADEEKQKILYNKLKEKFENK